MSVQLSEKLKTSFQGALAGGGDPASSPLYIFGPFFSFLIAANVAPLVYGSSIWLAVLTVVSVTMMYKMVMNWVADGSGGAGLAEEEFGTWAVGLNAGITLFEYTLTFLVSIAALVTFISDRLPVLNSYFIGIQTKVFVGVIFAIFTGIVVNRGPRIASLFFGPATALVLSLLWLMIGAVIFRDGLQLPVVNSDAFLSKNLDFTLGGFSRVLALMTGIEVFANLIPAYEGNRSTRSKLAFRSLLIIMGTTTASLLILAPAILKHTNSSLQDVSVFTQLMDHLLPSPLPMIGTFVGVAVLLSAAAASAQGIQNLALGLRYRHFLPPSVALRNQHGVAAKPVWIQVFVVTICLLIFGAHEETYLALYAAGVFILLSLTAWAAMKRLTRRVHKSVDIKNVSLLISTLFSAILVTLATGIVFYERFFSGAWVYVAILPIASYFFLRLRKKLGPPLAVEERIGAILSSSLLHLTEDGLSQKQARNVILLPFDKTGLAELAFPVANKIANEIDGRIRILHIQSQSQSGDSEFNDYISSLEHIWGKSKDDISTTISSGNVVDQIVKFSQQPDVSLVVLLSQGRGTVQSWLKESITRKIVKHTTPPLLILRLSENWKTHHTEFRHILIALDGSAIAEQVLPDAVKLSQIFKSKVTLLSVSDGSENDDFLHVANSYLQKISEFFKETDAQIICKVGSPSQVIVDTIQKNSCDLLMMVSHGRGGVKRQ